MSDSLLVALRNYRPRPGRDPLEDFITAAFAWTLRQEPAVAAAFLAEIAERAGKELPEPQPSGAGWDTHVSLDSGEADMLARTRDGVVLFEHKTYSEATADQINRYREAIGERIEATVLITASRWNYTGSDDSNVSGPDVHLTWGSVCEILDEAAGGQDNRNRIDDFLTLLQHEGLGPTQPLSEPRLRAFAASQNAIDEMFHLVDAVRRNCDWSFVYERLPAPSDEPQRPERWNSVGTLFHGRIPFDLFQPWRPGLRAGIIVDPLNIKTSLSDEVLGPDLAVYLGIPKHSLGSSRHQEVLRSAPLRNLCDRLTTETPDNWMVTARHGNAPNLNGHHPVVLQRPLAPVIRGETKRDQQRDAVYQVLRNGIELFLDGREMRGLRTILVDALDE